MPRLDGYGLLQKMKEKHIDSPVIFITAFASVESAVEAMQEGVVDYISKPFEEERIFFTIERTLNISRIMAENKNLKQEIHRISEQEEMVYGSSKMQQVVELASKVAIEGSTVMIHGESGTGKEVLARFIHKQSTRAQGRFVTVNCAAIPQGLVESELFGYEKGSFTGAQKRSNGKFEFASGGTLLLDEIGDLPLEAQAKLLRVLQEKTIQRVGGNTEVAIDVRIICATNQDLSQLVADGLFRSDLYYRIHVFPIELPPLRDRLEDLEILCQHFIRRREEGKTIKITPKALEVLKSYSWPGNIRELSNVIERACILSGSSGQITQSSLSFLQVDVMNSLKGKERLKLPPEGISLEDLEIDLVKQALELSGDNQSAAARKLGLTRAKFRVLHNHLKRLKGKF
jgi:DNA-binding NtrC family response regulator